MSLIIPRIELPISDDKNQTSRDWYKFFVQMAKAIGPSLTTADDLQSFQNTDAASAEAAALRAAVIAMKAESFALLIGEDLPKPPDYSLMAWWPGDVK